MSTAARPADAPGRRRAAPAAGAPAARQGTPRQPRHRAPLAVVPTPTARASSGAFALFVGAVLAVGLLGLLGLNTLLAQGAFATTDLARKQAALDTAAEALQQQVAVLESPEVLAVSAHRLGMVGTKNPVFLDPVTGKILGVPLAGAYPAPAATATPSGAPTAPATAATTTGATTKPTTGATKPPTTNPPTKPSPGTTTPGSH